MKAPADLMRSGRQVHEHQNLLQQVYGRALVLTLAAVFLIAMSGHFSVHAGDQCECAANEALTTARTWFDLRMWFEQFPKCDDGYLAEGVSEYVTSSLANRWSELPKLASQIKKNPPFQHFVFVHIDATADSDNLRLIVENATERCPRRAGSLCKAIANSARGALKDSGVAPAPDQARKTLSDSTNPPADTSVAAPLSPHPTHAEEDLRVEWRTSTELWFNTATAVAGTRGSTSAATASPRGALRAENWKGWRVETIFCL